MKTKEPKMIREKGKTRGLVPHSSHGADDKEYGAYLEKLNPLERTEVRHALACSPDRRFQLFLARITSGQGKLYKLQTHAKHCGIDMMEFNEWWNKASTQEALAIAQCAAPKVTAHMAIDAESRDRACSRCDGLGFVNADEGLPMETPGYRILRFVKTRERNEDTNKWEEKDTPVYIRTCPEGCDNGKVRKPGDQFSREKILEQAGLLNKKGAGLTVAVNFGGQSMASAVPRLNDAMTINLDAEEVN